MNVQSNLSYVNTDYKHIAIPTLFGSYVNQSLRAQVIVNSFSLVNYKVIARTNVLGRRSFVSFAKDLNGYLTSVQQQFIRQSPSLPKRYQNEEQLLFIFAYFFQYEHRIILQNLKNTKNIQFTVCTIILLSSQLGSSELKPSLNEQIISIVQG